MGRRRPDRVESDIRLVAALGGKLPLGSPQSCASVNPADVDAGSADTDRDQRHRHIEAVRCLVAKSPTNDESQESGEQPNKSCAGLDA